MNRKLKIAFVHMAFIYSGGGEKLVIKEVEWLRRQGHQVDCFSPLIWPEQCFPDLIQNFKLKELLPGFSWLYRRLKFNTMIYVLAALAPFIAFRLKNYDIVVGDHEPAAWFCFMVWSMFKTPYILYLAQPTRMLYQRKIDREVGLMLDKPMRFSKILGRMLKPLMYHLDQWVIASARLVVANGRYSQRVLEAIYGREVENCPAGANRLLRRLLATDRSTGEIRLTDRVVKKPFILVTNRHVPQKKFDWAVKILAKLAPDFPLLHLVITGEETDYTQKIRSLIEKLRLTDKVIFTGYVTEKDLIKLYVNSVVYIYPAPEEDFGMGIIEAMSAATPVVAWQAAGPAHLVTDQTGFLVDPGNLEAFIDLTHNLITNHHLARKLGLAGYRRAAQFSWDKHCRCLETFLRAAVNQSAPPLV
ncbi:hypothetical protein A2783_02615 [Microgenomates group bacterium RIFCSPHIGHO2_01_FULL_45_11]|nr:MAG: hypothetical protein A2783_02615 [Microgenomates group bacterium RIFCSPHIGHO2_01_FULL_45_11]